MADLKKLHYVEHYDLKSCKTLVDLFLFLQCSNHTTQCDMIFKKIVISHCRDHKVAGLNYVTYQKL